MLEIGCSTPTSVLDDISLNCLLDGMAGANMDVSGQMAGSPSKENMVPIQVARGT